MAFHYQRLSILQQRITINSRLVILAHTHAIHFQAVLSTYTTVAFRYQPYSLSHVPPMWLGTGSAPQWILAPVACQASCSVRASAHRWLWIAASLNQSACPLLQSIFLHPDLFARRPQLPRIATRSVRSHSTTLHLPRL